MTYADVYVIIDALVERHSWMSSCTNRFDITNFMAQSDASGYIVKRQKGSVGSQEDLLQL
jgi:hypothetical protein